MIWSAAAAKKFAAPIAGGLAALLVALIVAASPRETALLWRESAQDLLARAAKPTRTGEVVVVDIDQASLDALGPWPWPRQRIADLISRIAAAGPKAVGIDILLAGADRGVPAAVALAERAGRTDLAQAIADLPSEDLALANAIGAAPSVLAFLLTDTVPGVPISPVPVVAAGGGDLDPWHASGALLPLTDFQTQARGLGAGSLDRGPGGIVRSVSLLVAVGNDLGGGLAAETLRVAAGAGSYIVDLAEGEISLGPWRLPLDASATLRFVASPPGHWARRTVPAAALMTGAIDPARLRDRIVLVGGSAPEIGVLVSTAQSEIAPPVQVQADAVETVLSGGALLRPGWGWAAEMGGGAALSLIAILAFAALPPLPAGLATLVAVALWIGLVVILRGKGLMLDPATPLLPAFVAALATGMAAYARTRRAGEAMRRKFERHLAPSVVQRMVDSPGIVKLDGERRVVTALITDIEHFTTTVEGIDPAILMPLLDRYLEGVTGCIVRNGGLTDKMVGDGVHALFNAPVDLENHADCALACAFDIVAFSEGFRALPEYAMLDIGRTRIGIETGPAVVGEFGGTEKLDYTAYGSAVNMASRLEGLNKQFGTAICVGPGCRDAATRYRFRDLGETEIRGLGRFDVFEPVRLRG